MHAHDVKVCLGAVDTERRQVVIGPIDVCEDWIDVVGTLLIRVVFPGWVENRLRYDGLTPTSRFRSCLVKASSSKCIINTHSVRLIEMEYFVLPSSEYRVRDLVPDVIKL